MVKSYLRFEPKHTFGVIASPLGEVCLDATGTLAITPALEAINVWNIKQGALLYCLKEEENPSGVTVLVLSPDGTQVAAGYEDGRIRIWHVENRTMDLTLNGHRSAVTSLRYNKNGSLIVSGSRDTSVIVWDPVAETGLYRLKGHKADITDCRFLDQGSHKHLITSSKDGLVKVWDRDTQHCVQTVTGHRHAVWSFDVNKDETRLITGSQDNLLRVWRLKQTGDPESKAKGGGEEEGEQRDEDDLAIAMGTVVRSSRKRVVRVRFNPAGTVLACQSTDKMLELFRMRTPDEAMKKLKRRRKRVREKQRKKGEAEVPDDNDEVTPQDELEALMPIRTKTKISSFCFSRSSSRTTDRVLISLSNNKCEVHAVAIKDKTEHSMANSLDLHGHRTGIRHVALSSDGQQILSASSGSTKIWNLASGSCIRTLDTGYGLSAMFVPGDLHVLVGTRAGTLEVWELGSGARLHEIQAHDGPVWSMDLKPDGTGFVTGGGDKEVKFWEFELIKLKHGGKQLGVVHCRTLKLTDEALCVKHSPDGKYVAVGLLDCTVKLFFEDSLKFFLSLYGHKLPVLSLDISSDSTLIVTGSADKNVKLWGLDFGDCHKSLFAHADSVMRVAFVPQTHYFFSAGKDKLVKYWDGDKFEQITTLAGHHAEVWAMAVSAKGGFIVTASNDRSMRVWAETDEQLFLEEERELRMEAQFDTDVLVEGQRVGDREGAGLESEAESSSVASKQARKESVKAGEKLLESLDMATAEQLRWDEYDVAVARRQELSERRDRVKAGSVKGLEAMFVPEDLDKPLAAIPKPPVNPLMRGKDPEGYVLRTLKSIRRSHLDEALMTLPFGYAQTLLKYLAKFVSKSLALELSARCFLYLLNIHQNQIVANQIFVDTLADIRRITRRQLRRQKDAMGYNLAGLRCLKRELEAESNTFFFGTPEEAQKARDERRSEEKRRKILGIK